MRRILNTLLVLLPATAAMARSDIVRVAGAEFFGFKTYWTEKREGCQPMISFQIKNTSTGSIGPIAFHMTVVDNDAKSVFADGAASVPSADLPPGGTKAVIIGGSRDITAHECLGDMHESPFSTIHFAIRLTAAIGPDPASIEIVADAPMTEDRTHN